MKLHRYSPGPQEENVASSKERRPNLVMKVGTGILALVAAADIFLVSKLIVDTEKAKHAAEDRAAAVDVQTKRNIDEITRDYVESQEAKKRDATEAGRESDAKYVDNLNTNYTEMVNNGESVTFAMGFLQEKDENGWHTAVTNPLIVKRADPSVTKGGSETLYFGRVVTDAQTGKYTVSFEQFKVGEQLFVTETTDDGEVPTYTASVTPVGTGSQPNQACSAEGELLYVRFSDQGAKGGFEIGINLQKGGPLVVGATTA